MYLPWANSKSVSSTGCRTRAGALIDERTWRASSLLLIRRSAASAPGLVLSRTHRRHQRFISGSSAIDGDNSRNVTSNHSSVPNGGEGLSMNARHCSGVGIHG